MKKKRIMITAACIILLCIVVFLFTMEKKPYKNLDAAQIVSAKVSLTPPGKTLEIENIPELVDYLNDVVIYNRDISCANYDGQGVEFTLTMADGTQTEIGSDGAFFIIDGVRYRPKYEPWESLNYYANQLLNSGTANIILEEPPCLCVTSNGITIDALLGTYSWQKKDIDGTPINVNADSADPSDLKELLASPFKTPEATASLNFAEEPDTISSVRCWSDEQWGDPAAASEAAAISGNILTLKPGGYIYEIVAEWNPENGYGGTASYFIYLKLTE